MSEPKYTQEELDEAVEKASSEGYEKGYASGNALYSSRVEATEKWYREVILELARVVKK